jgi:hypothetical protein
VIRFEQQKQMDVVVGIEIAVIDYIVPYPFRVLGLPKEWCKVNY